MKLIKKLLEKNFQDLSILSCTVSQHAGHANRKDMRVSGKPE